MEFPRAIFIRRQTWATMMIIIYINAARARVLWKAAVENAFKALNWSFRRLLAGCCTPRAQEQSISNDAIQFYLEWPFSVIYLLYYCNLILRVPFPRQQPQVPSILSPGQINCIEIDRQNNCQLSMYLLSRADKDRRLLVGTIEISGQFFLPCCVPLILLLLSFRNNLINGNTKRIGPSEVN